MHAHENFLCVKVGKKCSMFLSLSRFLLLKCKIVTFNETEFWGIIMLDVAGEKNKTITLSYSTLSIFSKA